MLTMIIVNIEPKKMQASPVSEDGTASDIGLDLEFVHEISENLSNVIYDAYDDGELQKGRAFGSKGEHYAAEYLFELLFLK